MPKSTPENNFVSGFSPPPNLTQYLLREAKDQYYTGGGFGDVFRCWYHNGSPMEVAVKALRCKFNSTIDGDSNDKTVKMLHRELGIWRRLNHLNVVPFLGIAYGFGMRDSMSLVSLWMPNDSLHVFLSKHDHLFGSEHRLQLLLDIANGLHYLHSIPIIHGDLNSNNVLVDKDYNARLVDFGHASLAEKFPEALNYLQMSTTRPGALRWTAPEQIDPEKFSRTTKSDVYSFGCLGLQVLSGKLPWLEIQWDAAIVLELSKGRHPGRPVSQAIEDAHWDFIQDWWSPIEERPTAGEIIIAIQQFLNLFSERRPLRDLLQPLTLSDVPPPDSDTMSCICGSTYDDGFSITCDDCSRWCHAACFGIVPGGEVPEFWKCWVCDPTVDVDKERVVKIQKGQLRSMRMKASQGTNGGTPVAAAASGSGVNSAVDEGTGGTGKPVSRRKASPGAEKKSKRGSVVAVAIEDSQQSSQVNFLEDKSSSSLRTSWGNRSADTLDVDNRESLSDGLFSNMTTPERIFGTSDVTTVRVPKPTWRTKLRLDGFEWRDILPDLSMDNIFPGRSRRHMIGRQ